jgi:hypothetical protein
MRIVLRTCPGDGSGRHYCPSLPLHWSRSPAGERCLLPKSLRWVSSLNDLKAGGDMDEDETLNQSLDDGLEVQDVLFFFQAAS